MADENEIVAVFRADIEQYKKDVAEATAVTGGLDKKVEAVGETTKKFDTHTKGAAKSISTLSRGLGGITGLLGITGRLFGVNTDKLEGFIFASREFIKVAKDVQHAQHLSNLATTEGTVAKEASEGATISLTVAERILNSVRSAGALGIGLLVTALGALALGTWEYIKSANEQEEIQKKLKKLEQDMFDAEMDHNKQRRESNASRNASSLQNMVNENTITEFEKKRIEARATAVGENARLSAEESLAIRQVTIDLRNQLLTNGKIDEDRLAKTKEFIAIKKTFSDKEADVALRLKDKLIAIRVEEKKSNEEAAIAIAEDQEAFFDKQNEDNIKNAKKAAADLKALALKNAEDTRNALEQERQFRIASLSGLDEEEKKISLDVIQTRIRLGVATREEIDALTKYEIAQLKKVTDAQLDDFKDREDAQKKFTEFRIASLTGHDEEEKKIALQAIQIRKRLGTATEAELNALDAFEKKVNDKRIESAKQVSDEIFKAQEEGFNKRQELFDKEIEAQKTLVDTQRALAEKGLDNTLAFEERRAAELKRQQQKEVEAQKKVKLLETFLNSLAEFSKEDPKSALSKALLQVALATAASAVFAEEGGIIGEIGTLSGRRKHRGGGDVLLHAQTGEGILSRREMDNLGKRNFHLLKDAARFPIRDDVFAMPKLAMAGGVAVSNGDVVKELKALQHIIRNKRELEVNWDAAGNRIEKAYQDGITTITTKKQRFK